MLAASPRYLARQLRPVQPRTSAGVFLAHTWGSTRQGVKQRQWSAGVSAELAFWRLGAFLEVPMVWEEASTEGVYGPGEASASGIGDVRFGMDMELTSFQWKGLWWHVGAGVQVAAPTSGARQVEPDTPYLAVPSVELGPARWTVTHGPALAVAHPRWNLAAQLNADVTAQVWAGGQRWQRDPHLFASAALSLSWEPWWWLAPMLLWDFRFELYGEPRLRQLVFVSPAVRVRPHRRVSVDVGLRIPLGEEATDQQALSVGVAVTVGLESSAKQKQGEGR